MNLWVMKAQICRYLNSAGYRLNEKWNRKGSDVRLSTMFVLVLSQKLLCL